MGWSIATGHHEMYSERRLRHLRSYHYQAVDLSPISNYILRPYWNWAVTLLPLWMAPNFVTLIGLAFMALALTVVLFFTPDLVGPGPRWIYFLYAACLWLYSTLDNIDGKQVRRTGSSSPLGELFDHGVDALNCTIGGLVQVAALGLGNSWEAIFVLAITYWAFYLPTWEEYHTGILYLGYINGPTEGLLLAMTLMVLSGIYGPQLWLQPLGDWSPIGGSLAFMHVIILSLGLAFIFFYLPTSLYNVYQARKKNRKQFAPALLQILPMLAYSIATILWLWSPYSVARQRYFVLFTLSFGLAFGKVATKIIYAHLTKRRFPFYSGLMIPLFLGCLLVNLPFIGGPQINAELEFSFLLLWFAIALVGYGNWAYHLVHSFCGYLNIHCLRLKS